MIISITSTVFNNVKYSLYVNIKHLIFIMDYVRYTIYQFFYCVIKNTHIVMKIV